MKERLQSSTSYPITFLMVSSTDHITAVTGLSPTVTISKNGGGFASPSGAVTEIANGWYQLAGNATDRNTLGDLLVHATGTGADPVDERYQIVAFDPFDAADLGLTNLDATISSRGTADPGDAMTLSAGAITAAVIATGAIDADAIATDAITADKIAAGAITSSEAPALANLDTTVSSRGTADPGDAMTLAAGSITAAVIATGAIDDDAIAAGAIGTSEAPLLANLDAAISTRAAPGDAMTLTAAYDDAMTAAQPGDEMSLLNDAITAAKIAAGAITASEAPLLANLDATVSSRAVAGDSMALTAAAVDAVLDEVVEGAYTVRQYLRIFASALAAKLSGGGTLTLTFRDTADSKDRITATIDANNNRTAVTLDGT